jgi:dTDP-4-amino-4,6-dideoxygalactose transaminase
LSPNAQADDIKLAFSLLAKPGSWIEGPAVREFEQKFQDYLGVSHAYSFNSGRASLMAIMYGLDFEPGSQVLLQAFTCNAAANPIRWSGLDPVFVDCDDNYNLSVSDLKKKITAKSRAVMVQHTFGLPADIDEIKKVCDERGLVLIEDCAHSLGAEYRGQKVGTFGKVAFFSFSRDKIISCVYGGMAVTDDKKIAERMAVFQKTCGYPSHEWILQQLLHPVLMNKLVLPTYSIGGKYKLVALQKLHVLSKAIHWKEKRGRQPDHFPMRMPNAMAVLALNQFKKLDEFNEHRQRIAQIYYGALKSYKYVLPANPGDRKQVFLRFAVRYDRAAKAIKKAWSENLLIGDWYRTPVDPFDTKLETVGYKKGSCPRAEKFAGKMVNLPTHINISENEAKKIIKFIDQWK